MEQNKTFISSRYNKDGYIFPIKVMEKKDAAEIRSRLEKIEFLRGSMHYVVKPYLLMKWILDLSKKDEIINPVKEILGDDLLLWDSEFIIKEPGDNKIVEWHQDLMYFGLNSDDLVTVWIALSPVNKDSGCMEFIAGTHNSGLHEHHETHNKNSVLARGQELSVEIQLEHATDVILEPGEMSIHHGLTYHCSGPNISNDRRIALCFLYIKPSMKQMYSNFDSATLVSGTDKYLNFREEMIPTSDFSDRAIEYQAMIENKRKSLWKEAEITFNSQLEI